MTSSKDSQHRFAKALDRLEGDVELLRDMAAMTTPKMPALLGDADECMGRLDCAGAVRALHQLKGMISTFDSDHVPLKIQELLDVGRQGDLATMRERLQTHRVAIDELIRAIRAFAENTA